MLKGETVKGKSEVEAGEVVETAVPEPYVLSEVPEEPGVLVGTKVLGNPSTVGREEHAETQVLNEEEAGMLGNGETRPGSAPNGVVNGKAHGESRVNIIQGHKQL